METMTGSEVASRDYAVILEKQRKKAIELRNSSGRDRKKKLKKIRNWIFEHKDDIREALYNDYQKPAAETDLSESYVVISEIRHALRNLSQWMKKEKVDTPLAMLGTRSHIQYEPKGTCLIIAPWNFPFNLMMGPLVSAIAAGNTAILKPSEMTPHTSDLMEGMISELFEEDEVAVVQGGIEVSQALLALKFDHIFFTGSPKVGKIIMEAAAKNLTSVTLELGGKSPAIVDETAAINDTAEKLVAGKYVNNGQTCIAPDYVMAHESIYTKLIEKIKEKTAKSYDPDGKGIEQNSDYGRLVNERHFKVINGMIEDAVSKGAKVEMGGKTTEASNFVEPTLLSEVPENSTVLQEEIFGPVLPIIPYTNLDEVIDRINAGEKPLALYVYSRKKSHQDRILKSCSSGTACVNESVVHFLNHYLPFGGVNNSGIGKSHGYYGFLAFSNAKGVLKQRVGFTTAKLIGAPYDRFTKFVIDTLLKYL